ncbi:MAG: hypothetical protein WAO19_07140 [Candidatus Kryptoniota bacterium]
MKRILFFASTIIYSSLFVSSCHKNENPVAATMPSITTQPISQTIAVGTAATFTVVASGAEPLNYQWFENGVAINNATLATYVTPTMNVGGSAAFTVTVSNSLGSDTSNIATLNVLTSGTLKVHSGKYWDWYADASTWAANVAAVTPIFPVMDTATDQLDRDWGTSSPTAKLYVYIDASLSGAAYSTGDISQVDDARGKSPSPGIGLAPDLFTGMNYGAIGGTAIVFGVHETVNQRTANVSVAGWPVDWWADNKSPFPGMTEVHLLNQIGYNTIAKNDDLNLSGDPLYLMMKNIQAHYGWGIFTNMFSALRAKGVNDWSYIDGGAANPSSELTAYVTAYMVKASGEPIATFNAFVSGVIPTYSEAETQAIFNSL